MATIPPLRLLGAALLIVGGAVHLQLSFEDYGTADIDRAFALNALASALVAAYLVLRSDDLVGPLAGVAVSAGALVAFALSRTGDGILDFRAAGLEPAPEALITLITEVAAVAILALAAIAPLRRPTPVPDSRG